jgi:hypothetical protein
MDRTLRGSTFRLDPSQIQFVENVAESCLEDFPHILIPQHARPSAKPISAAALDRCGTRAAGHYKPKKK